MKQILNDFLIKKEGFSSLPFIEQVKYMAYFFMKITGNSFFQVKDIEHLFELGDVVKPANIPDMLYKLRLKKIIIPKEMGFTLQRDEFITLDKEFLDIKSSCVKIIISLDSVLVKIKDANQNVFLKEVISCYKIGAFRSSIIMMWCLTMDHIQNYVLNNKLNEFNLKLQQQYPKSKQIVKKEDFSEIDESKFIEVCRLADIVTKDRRKILDEKLGVRNSAAHPNDIIFSESKVTGFIEDLLENIILKI